MKKQNLLFLIIILSSICCKVKAQQYNPVGVYDNILKVTTNGDTMYALSSYYGQNPSYKYYRILKYDGINWAPLDTFSTAYGNGNNHVYCLEYYQGELYLGGQFDSVAGVPNTKCIAAWNNGIWHDVGGGLNLNNGATSVRNMILYQNKLVISGADLQPFAMLPSNPIYEWDGINYSNIGLFNFWGTSCGITIIEDLKIYNNELYVSGLFNTIDSTQIFYNVAKYNGNTNIWSPIGNTYADTSMQFSSLAILNNEVYVSYLNADIPNNATLSYVKKWNGISWTLLNQTTQNSSCYTCAFWSVVAFENKIFLGGNSAFFYGAGILYNNMWSTVNFDPYSNICNFFEFQGKLFFIGYLVINGTSYDLGYFDPPVTMITENELNNNLTVFPNPSNTSFTSSFSISLSLFEIHLYNSLGTQVYFSKEQTSAGKFSKQINVENLSSGLYFLEVKTKEGVLNKKVVVQH